MIFLSLSSKRTTPMPPKQSDWTDQEIVAENREWIESLDYIYANQGPQRVVELMRAKSNGASKA